MRLFIAAELPDQVLEALAETSARVRGCVRGRYVAPNTFHVTLAFLGDVQGSLAGGVMDALDEGCAGYGPVDVMLGELGSFGRRKKATLWQGFAEAGHLPDVASSVRASLQSRGFSFDEKAFLPHITLMRVADLSSGTLPAPAIASGQVQAVTLFRSDLSGPCPVYDSLHTVYLESER